MEIKNLPLNLQTKIQRPKVVLLKSTYMVAIFGAKEFTAQQIIEWDKNGNPIDFWSGKH